MEYTSKYKLKKPQPTDYYNVADFNENADTIDAKLYAAEQALSLVQQLQTKVQALETAAAKVDERAKIKLRAYAEPGTVATISCSGYARQSMAFSSNKQEVDLPGIGEWTFDYTYRNRTYSKTLSVEGPGVTQVALAPDLEAASWGFIDLVGSVGLAKTCWAIGDTKEIMVGSGEGNAAVLLDFDHDVLSEPNPKGVGKKAAMTFGLAQPLQTKAAMHSVAESTDWANRDMITTYLPARYEDLGTYEPELYNAIKTVQKVIMKPCSDVSTDTGWQAIGGAETPLDCELFLFSEREIFGSNRYSIPFYSYEEPYELYKWGYPFIQPMDYWLRSTHFYTSGDCSTGAVVVRGNHGWMREDTLTALNGVLYGFCI